LAGSCGLHHHPRNKIERQTSHAFLTDRERTSTVFVLNAGGRIYIRSVSSMAGTDETASRARMVPGVSRPIGSLLSNEQRSRGRTSGRTDSCANPHRTGSAALTVLCEAPCGDSPDIEANESQNGARKHTLHAAIRTRVCTRLRGGDVPLQLRIGVI
jgi:hypothetical protein